MDKINEWDNIKRKLTDIDSDYIYETDCLIKENKKMKKENNRLKCGILISNINVVKSMYLIEIEKKGENILELEKQHSKLQIKCCKNHKIPNGNTDAVIKETFKQQLGEVFLLGVDVLHQNQILKEELELKSAIYDQVSLLLQAFIFFNPNYSIKEINHLKSLNIDKIISTIARKSINEKLENIDEIKNLDKDNGIIQAQENENKRFCIIL